MNAAISKIILFVFAGVFLLGIVSNCPSKSRTRSYNTVETRTIVPDEALASEQFDLRVLEGLLKETADAGELEKRLNEADPKLHNLDLDEDEKVDYINVDEYGSGDARGLALTVELAPEGGEKQIQEIARIDIEKTSDTSGRYEIQGNRSIYGSGHYYRSGFDLGDALLLGWMFSDRSPYQSSWGYNNYPGGYRASAPVSTSRYRSNIGSRTQSSTLSRATTSSLSRTATSPTAGRSAANVRAPLKNPTATQKTFQARNPSKKVKTGGFGRSVTSRPSAPSVRKSSSSRSRSFSFGGK